MKKYMYPIVILLLLFTACGDDDNNTDDNDGVTISSLRFIGEQLIPDGELLDGEVIGGLSGIDYANGTYYMISDAPDAPIRFYTAALNFNEESFSEVTVLSQAELLNSDSNSFESTQADPEAIRFDPETGLIVWTSEGYVNEEGINPFVREASVSGEYVGGFEIPVLFQVNEADDEGPRNNGTFEGLSLSTDGLGYWVAMELPLIQDGPAPVFEMDTESPVRISYINKATGQFGRQFAYELDPVVRSGGFTVNGVVEILEYDKDRFLVLERSFATGYDDGGNDVRIYDVNAGNATDVSSFAALAGEDYTPATKTLLFDFESIRSQLSTLPGETAHIVDNIEGITFGPDLPNGNRSLILVADNNFSAFGPQLNQFIVLEVLP